ncbi:MAG: NAD-dependent epimerase/dehydratase family protein [Anaerolineaceae bacterium]|nr:NAD-dependent epimerase/dehydratase family protein [Anaerolineaceae bacterium]MBN2677756.1 NAD-dependent epimerase/dehydratase family protein [Anaerolineaceae bacterium]
MNFVITGGAGFLGSGLANILVRQGHNVRVIDDLSTGNPDRLSPEIHFTRGDINDRPKLWTLLQDVDCVYHLAARVSVPESVLYPRDYNQVNVGGTVTLMEAVHDVGIKRVILVSSGAVYGNQARQPLKESTLPNPESPYAVSKLAAEYYVRTIGRLWGIETVCLRVFNAYGPGQHIPPTHAPVIPNFLRQSMHNGTLVIQGDGSQTRDYVYVDDVVMAMAAAATTPKIDQLVINIGSGKETSIRDLAKLVMKITENKPEVVTNGQADPGVSHMCADIWLASQKLKYKPLVSLETGLKLTFERDENLKKMNGKSNGHTT